MISKVLPKFKKCFKKLPKNIQKEAISAYKIWKRDPFYPPLSFERKNHPKPIYSVSIGPNWRALGILKGNIIYWFWIGSHEDYNQLVKTHRLTNSTKSI